MINREEKELWTLLKLLDIDPINDATMRETVHEAIGDGSIAFTGNIVGWVIFARNEMPDWINAMFKMV